MEVGYTCTCIVIHIAASHLRVCLVAFLEAERLQKLHVWLLHCMEDKLCRIVKVILMRPSTVKE